jgi:hypothetical protein
MAVDEVEKTAALNYLQFVAAKRGKSLQEFIDTDLRRILETAWEMQQRTGSPVPFTDLFLALQQQEAQ